MNKLRNSKFPYLISIVFTITLVTLVALGSLYYKSSVELSNSQIDYQNKINRLKDILPIQPEFPSSISNTNT